MIPEPMSKDVGQARIEPEAPVRAGARGRWTVTYQAGGLALGPGSLLRFTVPYGFTTPNFLWVTHPGYVHLSCSRSDVTLRFVLPEPVEGETHDEYMTRWGAHLFVEVVSGTVAEGDTVSLIYGYNPFYPQMGAWAPYFTQEFTWWVAVRPRPPRLEEGFVLVADPPTLRVEPGLPARAGAVGPPLAARGETLRFRTYEEDGQGNRIVPPVDSGSLVLRAIGDASGAGSWPLGPVVEVKADLVGPLQAAVEVEGLAETGRSNPVLVSEEPPAYRLYWGDVHGHSLQSDGLGTVEEYYAYGREQALLDFWSIADHRGHMGPGEWERARAAADAADDPGSYVAFSGYELNDRAGEKCVYFRRDSHPMYRYPEDERVLFELARAGEALVIPHQHGRGPWPYPRDVIRVTEVYSIWGAFEYPGNPRPCIGGGDYHGRTVLDMLKAGYRPGVIGGSDCHAGHPGHTDWLRHTRAYPNGLAAVYAPELTREALWEALLARRCYATSGPRIIVGLRCGDAWMGSELPVEAGRERVFDIDVVAEDALRRVVLVKNGQPRFILPGSACLDLPHRLPEQASSAKGPAGKPKVAGPPGEGQVLRTTVSDVEGSDEPAFYYLRVEQEDGEMAWSSPLWFVTG